VIDHLEEGSVESGGGAHSAANSGSFMCTPCPKRCGKCAVRGLHQILYALVSLFVTVMVLVVILIDLLVTKAFDAREVLYMLGMIVTLWAQSPAQPLLDNFKKKEK
jgi:hypothetical protein